MADSIDRLVISDEFALTVACSCWPALEGILGQVCSRAGRLIDWDRFLEVVERHRLVGLVNRTLYEAGVTIPAPTSAIFKEKSRHIAKQNLKIASEISRLQRQFDAAGISMLILKGISLGQRAYGTFTLKHGRDIDILVQPVNALRTLALLELNEYSIFSPTERMDKSQRRAFVAFGCEIELLNAAKDVRIELHWRLSENHRLISDVDAFSAAQDIALVDMNIRTLGDADTFVYLCVHGAKHSWFRLKWLADLNAWLGQISESEIRELYAYAQKQGADLCAAQALMLCHRLFQRSLPNSMVAEFGRNKTVQRLVRTAMQRMIEPAPTPEIAKSLGRQIEEGAQQFLLGRGIRFLASQCAIAFTAHADVLRWPLPRWLGFIYWGIRIPSLLLRRLGSCCWH